ncbi:MAG: hypothetical protein K6E47_00280 [Lachnospiraceae bacterium]|nr:hypothetical protein [Lachnospiraceae bacterium]
MQKNAEKMRIFPRLIAVLVLLTMIIGTIPVSADDSISDWVPISEVPSGAEIVDRKWVYDYTEYTESQSSSLSGWTQTGSYWLEIGRGEC